MRSAGVVSSGLELESATSSFPFTAGAAIDVPESVSVELLPVFHYVKMVNEVIFGISKTHSGNNVNALVPHWCPLIF